MGGADMTPLLQQAREAMAKAQRVLADRQAGGRMLTTRTEAGEIYEVCQRVANALDAYDAMSDYDKAVEALAPYLPDGFVAQDADGQIVWYADEPERGWEGNDSMWFTQTQGGETKYFVAVDPIENWRASLHEIRAGRVVPQPPIHGDHDGREK